MLCACAWAYSVKDARGRVFEFSKPPVCATIVPAVTQNIYAIGAGDLLVANSRFCTYPPEARKKIKLGGYIDPDYEKIVSLNPDVFILPSTSDPRLERRLEDLGVRCFILNGEGIDKISADIRLLGRLFDKRDDAEKVALEFEKLVDSPFPAGAGRRAMFMFGKMAAGRGSFAGGLVEACGLVNCADKIGRPWAEVSKEFVLSARPEILFIEFKDSKGRERLELFYKTDPIWRTTPAVKNGRLCFVPRGYVIVPSVRVAEALRLMREFCANK